jgi:hypothetical protein
MRVHGWSAAIPCIELVDTLALAARIAPMMEELEGVDGATPGCVQGPTLKVMRFALFRFFGFASWLFY